MALIYKMRAIAQNNSEYVFWTDSEPDIDGSNAPEAVVLDSIVVNSIGGTVAGEPSGPETYSVDFSTLPAGAISNGSLSIGGKTWTVSNVASAASFVAGTNGLEFSANTTNSTFLNSGTRNATRLTIKLDSLFTSLLPTKRALLRLGWTNPTNDANADYELFGIQIDNDTGSNCFWATRGHHAGFGSQTIYYGMDSAGGALAQGGFNTNWSTHKATAVEIYGIGEGSIKQLYIYNAVPAANDAIPSASSFNLLGELSNSSPPFVNGWDELYLHLFWVTFNTSGSFNASIRAFKAELVFPDFA